MLLAKIRKTKEGYFFKAVGSDGKDENLVFFSLCIALEDEQQIAVSQ